MIDALGADDEAAAAVAGSSVLQVSKVAAWSANGERFLQSTEPQHIFSKNGKSAKLPRPVLHAAWSPIDPHCLATVGGDDAPRSLRVWRLKA